MTEVIVYTTKLCPYCHAAKGLLRDKGVAFQEIDVTFKPRRRTEMMERAGGRHSVPQIFIDDQAIGGCDELHALEHTGKLDPLLGRST